MKKILILLAFYTFYTYSQEAPEEQLKRLFENDNFKEIIALKEKLNEDEYSAAAFYYTAIAYYDSKDYQNAVIYFNKAISKGPAEGKMYHFCALSYKALKDTAKALEYLDIVIKKFPEKSTYLTEKAEILIDKGEYDGAIILLNDALTKERVTGKAFYLLSNIYYNKKNDNAKALDILYKGKLITENDDEHFPIILYEISLLEFEQGHHAKSNEALFELLLGQPDNYFLYPVIIQNYFELNKLDSAAPFQKKLYEAKHENKLRDDLAKRYCFDRFKWKDKWVHAFENYYIPDPEKDVRFHKQVYIVYNQNWDEEFTIQTELFLTFNANDGVVYVLGKGKYIKEEYLHQTFGTLNFREPVDYQKLKEGVLKVLEEKVEPTSSSKSKRKD